MFLLAHSGAIGAFATDSDKRRRRGPREGRRRSGGDRGGRPDRPSGPAGAPTGGASLPVVRRTPGPQGQIASDDGQCRSSAFFRAITLRDSPVGAPAIAVRGVGGAERWLARGFRVRRGSCVSEEWRHCAVGGREKCRAESERCAPATFLSLRTVHHQPIRTHGKIDHGALRAFTPGRLFVGW